MEEDELRAGVKTNEDFKLAMTTSLDMVLRMRQMRFHRNFFSVGDKKVSFVDNESTVLREGDTDTVMRDADDTVIHMMPRGEIARDAYVDEAIERERRADSMRDMIIDQLRRWTRTLKPRKDPSDPRPPSVFLSGKAGGQDDDGVIGLCLPQSMRKRFHTSDKYRKFWTNTASIRVRTAF